MAKDFQGIMDELWKDQSEKNWTAFSAALKKSKARYYNVVFTGKKVNKIRDLGGSFVELFDSKEKMIGKVPIFVNKGKEVEGATIYLRGLLNVRKEMT